MTYFMRWIDPHGESHIRDPRTGRTLCGKEVGHYSDVRARRVCPGCVSECIRREAQRIAGSTSDGITDADSVSSVWWLFPDGDYFQHVSVTPPPLEGGEVETLGGHMVRVPPRGENKVENRPWCPSCMAEFLALPVFVPSVWAW
jgi:hypothetical protein